MKKSKDLDWETGIGVLEDNILETHAPRTEQDRRRAPRVKVNVPIRFRLSGHKEMKWESGESLDVSRYGVRLASLSPDVRVGSRLDLTIKLPESRGAFDVRGVVVWVKPNKANPETVECGVSFENPEKTTRLGKLLSFFADKLLAFALKQSKQLEGRPVNSVQELQEAYQLVYKQYLKRGYCRENSSKMYYTYYCVLPKAQAFVLKENDNLLGTISLIPDSDCGLPMEYIFPEEIQKIRKRENRRLAEVSLLALDLEYFEKKSFTLTDIQKLSASFKIFKTMFDYAHHVLGITDLLICMHPKHQKLYEYLKFHTIGSVRPYSSACLQPALPMHLDISAVIKNTPRDQGIGTYFLKSMTPASNLADRYKNNKQLVRKFLLEVQEMWPSIPREHQQKIENYYPGIAEDASDQPKS